MQVVEEADELFGHLVYSLHVYDLRDDRRQAKQGGIRCPAQCPMSMGVKNGASVVDLQYILQGTGLSLGGHWFRTAPSSKMS
jgi:hypothetical protein